MKSKSPPSLELFGAKMPMLYYIHTVVFVATLTDNAVVRDRPTHGNGRHVYKTCPLSRFSRARFPRVRLRGASCYILPNRFRVSGGTYKDIKKYIKSFFFNLISYICTVPRWNVRNRCGFIKLWHI